MSQLRLLAREVGGVSLSERRPLVGQLIFSEARVHGTGLDAGVAVDALVRVDVELLDLVVVGFVGRRMDAVDRADLDAGIVLGSDAGLGDHIGHIPNGGIGCATNVLLLTGATGLVGHAVVRRLVARGTPVRCLVRDPRRLGPQRVRVQLAIGDLADPSSWRNALRGVDTVVHLAGGARDQPRATVEELNGLAAWRLLRAAERVGARHFVWITPLSATPHHPMRMQRAKALAAAAVAEAEIATTTLAHSLIYAPGDRRLRWLERLGYLPAVPLVGRGIARTQPLWAQDAADCVLATLDRGPAGHARYELAGPETLTQREVVRLVLAAAGRRRRTLPIPLAGLRAALNAEETLAGPTSLVTWDEAQLLAVEMLSAGGTADAEQLGVTPHRMAEVVGAPTGAPLRAAPRAAAAVPR